MCLCHTGQDSNPPTHGPHECPTKFIPFTTVPSPDGSPVETQAHWLQGARKEKMIWSLLPREWDLVTMGYLSHPLKPQCQAYSVIIYRIKWDNTDLGPRRMKYMGKSVLLVEALSSLGSVTFSLFIQQRILFLGECIQDRREEKEARLASLWVSFTPTPTHHHFHSPQQWPLSHLCGISGLIRILCGNRSPGLWPFPLPCGITSEAEMDGDAE